MSLLRVLDRLRTDNTPVPSDRVAVNAAAVKKSNDTNSDGTDVKIDSVNRELLFPKNKRGLQTPQFERERSASSKNPSSENFSSIKKSKFREINK